MTTIDLTIATPAGRPRSWRFEGPSGWDKLSPAQAVALMRFRYRVAGEPQTIFPVLALIYGFTKEHQRWLFDERFLRRKNIPEETRFQALQYGQALIDSIRWIGESQPGPSFLVSQFSQFSYRYGTPRVLLRRLFDRQRYYAPREGLSSSTFEEFMYAEKAYKDKNFALLTAILYRPATSEKQKTGDIRLPLDKHTVEKRAKRFERLEPALIALVVAHYEACQQNLQRAFPRVFPKQLILEGQQPPKPQKNAGNWLDVALGLAKLDVTKISQIEQTNLYLALKVLDEQIRQADELEKELEKTRKT
ncbi:hypothetical protein [Spirosoma sp.]|uniref:hypothetical protein n=1 Tax=Spirosoma sp. TaxID=1899569 RepID=UPI0026180238|nr:hypothetical protein [Spirosoma sp.]MCX6216491.1 hypothetical protein [Spirosoma sp.]